MTPVAITLEFDPAADLAIRSLWRQMRAAGFPQRPLDGGTPHITLAVYEQLDVPVLINPLLKWARAQPALRVCLGTLATFAGDEGVVYAAPTGDLPLREVQSGLVNLLAAHGALQKAYYEPALWTPHCTLVMWALPAGMQRALAIAQAAPWPIWADITRLRMTELGEYGRELLVAAWGEHGAD